MRVLVNKGLAVAIKKEGKYIYQLTKEGAYAIGINPADIPPIEQPKKGEKKEKVPISVTKMRCLESLTLEPKTLVQLSKEIGVPSRNIDRAMQELYDSGEVSISKLPGKIWLYTITDKGRAQIQEG